ncbi:glutathione S-transferase [Sphingobium xenophagum]|uniref:glutathione S-transferase n=1 Tax=Sphingobium xenophagum TaxID=121428 RepID=UPI00036DEEAC|nr:glutathione S-transferase [Sphingobium xenophagum]
MSSLPILYSFRRCPYAMRARLALLVSGQAVALREVVLRDKPDALRQASPKATVPVLVLPDGQAIDQSIDIMRWALGRTDPEGWLMRDDAGLIAANDGPFKMHLDRTKYPDRHGSDPAVHRGAALDWLHVLDRRLHISAQLCGAARGLADMAIFPFVRQFAAIDPAWFEAQPLPHLRRWLDIHLHSPLFAAAMLRVPPWREGGAPVIFPPAAAKENIA